MADEEVLFDDAFDWDSGLVDQVNFTIDSARWTYSQKIKNGEQLVLALAGNTVDPETGEQSEHEMFLSCGDGWEPANGGDTARREDGRDKMFNARSAIATFINAAVKAGLAKGEIVAAGGPLSAKVWPGRTFFMEAHEFSGTFDGKERKWSKLLPTKVVSGEAKTSAKASKPAPAAESTSTNEGVSAALKAKLTALAKECETHDAFIDAAFSKFESDVSGNTAVEGLVVDPTFYTEARG